MTVCSPFPFRRRAALSAGLAVLWIGLVLTGLTVTARYEMHAGPAAQPTALAAASTAGRARLIMFAHPLCPCSRASITELGEILRAGGREVEPIVMMAVPTGAGPEWTQSALWKQAAALPGVAVRADLDGALARRLGAETSGHVIFYDAAGQVRFFGGITGARGHLGRNRGEMTVLELLQQSADPGIAAATPAAQAPVYGCELPQLASKGSAAR